MLTEQGRRNLKEEKDKFDKSIKVRKRSGDLLLFDEDKITDAINNAYVETHGYKHEVSEEISNKIHQSLKSHKITVIDVELIQDMVEEHLMESGYTKVAKNYILYRYKRTLDRKADNWLSGDMPESIWERKYKYNGEDVSEFLYRVSGGNKSIRRLIFDKKFSPAGRILSNRGLHKYGKKVTYSNCYVITPPEDNIESIYEVDRKFARTFSYGGGAGSSIMNLAPRGAKVNNTAKTSSGSVSFLTKFDGTAELIGQNGRRAASLLDQIVSHPDIFEFIDIKNDTDKITKANLSVRITDEFMDKYINNEDFRLRYERSETGELIENIVPSSKIMNKIAYSSWNTGEPGVLFWDRISNWNLLSKDDNFEYAGVNPCWTGDTEVFTADNEKVTFKELAEKGDNVEVYAMNPDTLKTEIKTMRNPRLTRKNAPVYRLTVDKSVDTLGNDYDGLETYKVTADHNVYVWDDYRNSMVKKEVKDLNKGDRLVSLQVKKQGWNNDLMIRDKYLGRTVYRPTYSIKTERKIGRQLKENEVTHHKNGDHNDNRYENLSPMLDSDHKSYHLKKRIENNSDFSSHPGEENGRYIDVTKDELIKRGLELLDDNGKITRSMWVKDCDSTGYPKRKGIENRFGSWTKFKNIVKDTAKDLENVNHRVVDVEFIGYEDVYNGTVDDYHNYFVCDSEARPGNEVTGILSANCGEEPLPAGGSCLLGAINLSELVRNPFESNAHIDESELDKVVRDGVSYLNEVLDEGLPLHPLEEQRKSVKKWRQIGLGIMGQADLFIKLRVKYGSTKSLNIINRLGHKIINSALQQSALLAKEEGTYPGYNEDAVLRSEFLLENATEETYELVSKYGLRNSQLLTIAPTGSTSNLFEVSGGIEPLFNISYTRKAQFDGKEAEEFEIISKIARTYMDKYGVKEVENLPDYFVSAHDIDPFDRIEVQSAWQQYIDASISSTINLPNETTVQEVKDIYTTAWMRGLKGLTVFRDGCKRAGILTTDDSKKKDNKTEMTEQELIDQGICPYCYSNLEHIGGCIECTNCQKFSACSV